MDLAKDILLLSNGTIWHVGLLVYLIRCVSMYDMSATREGKGLGYLYDFVTLVLTSYGGGIIVPVLLGKVPFPLKNDESLYFILVLYLIRYLDSRERIRRLIWESVPIIGLLVNIGFEIFRAGVLITWLEVSRSMLTTIGGPIICGAIAGCCGKFLSYNFWFVNKQRTWADSVVISAILASGFYHLSTNYGYLTNDQARILVCVLFIYARILPVKNITN